MGEVAYQASQAAAHSSDRKASLKAPLSIEQGAQARAGRRHRPGAFTQAGDAMQADHAVAYHDFVRREHLVQAELAFPDGVAGGGGPPHHGVGFLAASDSGLYFS